MLGTVSRLEPYQTLTTLQVRSGEISTCSPTVLGASKSRSGEASRSTPPIDYLRSRLNRPKTSGMVLEALIKCRLILEKQSGYEPVSGYVRGYGFFHAYLGPRISGSALGG